ncbi:MAG: twin-arginine translocation signal domain-containing protein, partial [Candidatus Bipolaricaulia bacterium]
MSVKQPVRLSRRDFLRAGAVGIATGGTATAWLRGSAETETPDYPSTDAHAHDAMGTVGTVDHERNGFDPHRFLKEYNYGEESQLPDGRT